MPDPPLDTDAKDDTRTPLWVKVFGAIVLVVVLAFAIVLVTQGPHRPDMPMQHSGGGDAPSSSVTALGAGGSHNPSDWGH